MVTQERLRELLFYDPVTGLFVRNVAVGGQLVDAVAGHRDNGYIKIRVDGRTYKAHRLAWFYVHGEWPEVIDHINRIRSDNRLVNLRNVTKGENNKNHEMFKNNTSGVTGVCWRGRDSSWCAFINVEGKKIHLGQRKDKFEAICLRKSAELNYGYL